MHRHRNNQQPTVKVAEFSEEPADRKDNNSDADASVTETEDDTDSASSASTSGSVRRQATITLVTATPAPSATSDSTGPTSLPDQASCFSHTIPAAVRPKTKQTYLSPSETGEDR